MNALRAVACGIGLTLLVGTWGCGAPVAAVDVARGDGSPDAGDAVVGDAPIVDVPGMDVPTADVPNIDAVDPDATRLDAPPADGPTMDAPGMDAPRVDAPGMDAPRMDTPVVDVPRVDAPLMDTGCPPGQQVCASRCTDVQTDRANCGACARACAAGQVCVGGTCRTTCTAPLVNCAGSCVNTSTNTAHCGACGRACVLANATPNCVAGVCGVATCTAGFGNCDGVAANGCEVNLQTTVAHCGACGRACALPNAVEGCVAGACTIASCSPGFANCDGMAANGCETNTATSAAHCGGCGRPCAAGQVCMMGTCRTTCTAPLVNCSGSCVNTQTDPANCGMCARACTTANGRPSCAAGVCGIASCNAGFGNCDGMVANGCETNLNTSVANCGACARVCNLANANESCTAGVCGIASCTAGFGNCDGVAANGCEVNTNTNPAHCGGCGRACGAGQTCMGGACVGGCGLIEQVCCPPGGSCGAGLNCRGFSSPATCCHEVNGTCSNDNQCCGLMLCNRGTGRCACNNYGEPCASLLDCCDPDLDPQFCDVNTTSPTIPVCCKPPLFPCRGSQDCCGYSTCVGGTCACIPAGGPCVGGECCLPLSCRGGRCG